MDAVAPSDAGRDGRSSNSNSNSSSSTKDTRDRGSTAASKPQAVNYVRDGAVAAHKRGVSGSLLNKLGFARSTLAEPAKASQYGPLGAGEPAGVSAAAHAPHETEAAAAGRAAMSGGNARRLSMATPSLASYGPAAVGARSRKGSLRKNILRKGSLQHMETILSPRIQSRMSSSTDGSTDGSIMSPTSPDAGDVDDDYPTPRGSYERTRDSLVSRAPSSTSSWSAGAQDGLWLDENLATGALNTSSLSRSSTLRDNSTTDEDEKPPGSSSSNASSGLMMAPKRLSVTSDSYFPLQPETVPTGPRRRPSPMKSSRITKSSPLSALPLDAATAGPLSPEIWDYGETEWWGWIILITTWICFVVGMGSCFGTWSWAWDVGETPYAPPELEDDPTLPIIGYYPALIVLTGVMAWVWVIIAWVGMKYFKHAKMSGEDG